MKLNIELNKKHETEFSWHFTFNTSIIPLFEGKKIAIFSFYRPKYSHYSKEDYTYSYSS